MSKTHWYLKHCDLFEQLSESEIGRLETRSRTRDFKRGCPIYLPADPGDAVYLLVEGRIKICYFGEDGKETILAFVEPGELFGELAVVREGPRGELAECVEDSRVAMIPRAAMQELMRDHADVSLGITKIIGFRRIRIENRLKNLLFRSNRERLVHLLLDLAEEHGEDTSDGVQLRIRLSHQDLASIIGVTRETVSLTMRDLRNAKLIDSGRCRITLPNPCELARSVKRTFRPRSHIATTTPKLVSAM